MSKVSFTVAAGLLLSSLSHAQAPDEGASASLPVVTPVAGGTAMPVTDSAPEARARPGNVLVEEVVVTAQKREENIQDVPISISAFTARQLEAIGADKPKDLAQITPGLVFTEFAGYTLIYIRGVGTDNFVPSAEPSIAIYVDGVYTPLGQGFASDFGAVERVEVLKGPQGTLFGRNSTGGAISITTKSPDSVPDTTVDLSYGKFDSLKTRVHTNIPVADEFAVSVSGVYNKGETYYTAKDPSPGFPPEVTKGFRVKARWFPSDDFDVVLTGLRLQQSLAASSIATNHEPSPLFSFIPAQPDDYTVEDDAALYSYSHQAMYALNSTWKASALDVKLILAAQDVTTPFVQYDFDGSRLPLVSFYVSDEYIRTKTAELQFISNENSWGADWLKSVAGIYYLDSEGGFNPVNLQVAGSVVDSLPDVPGSLAEFLQGTTGLPFKLPNVNNFRVGIFGLLGTQSLSGFFQSTASLSDRLDLTLGGRYQREERKLLESSDAISNTDGSYTKLLSWPQESKTVNNFSPKIALSYKFSDDILAYTSFTKGFKSQTYNIINIYKPPQYLPPEEVSSYEAGFKSDLLDRTLRFNAAVFQSSIKNLQTGFVSLLSGGAVNFQTAGEARIRGAEAELVVVPMAATNPGLVISANGSYLDAIYTKYLNGNGYDETTGIYSENNDFSGNRIVRTPKFSGTLGINQSVEAPGGVIDMNASVYYSDLYWFSSQNAPGTEQPAYYLLSAQLSYRYEPWRSSISLFGSNLGDEKYYGTINQTDFGIMHFLAPPRQYGVRLSVNF